MLTYIGIIYTNYIVTIYISPYILSIGILYKILYKHFLYVGTGTATTKNVQPEIQVVDLDKEESFLSKICSEQFFKT